MKQWLLLMLLGGFMLKVSAQANADSMINVARDYFTTVAQVCASPAAQLWNKDLSGPVMLVDPVSRKVYTNAPDKEGLLQAAAAVYTGVLPGSVNIANTATTWAGVQWTMLLLPLPAAKTEREQLMVHELFHRIQSSLGFAAGSPVNDHLDSKEGRIFFRLELEALKAALRAPLRKRQHHLQLAVAYRRWRYALFPAAKEKEEALELNEGLAEFTGVFVSGRAAQDTAYLPSTVDHAATNYPSFSRAAAYITGPLYGILLSQRQPGWQLSFTAQDNLPDRLIRVYQLKVPPAGKELIAQVRPEYNEGLIRQEEETREQDRLAKEKRYLARLVQGPVLELALTKQMRFSFNPNTVFPLGEQGTVYPTMTMIDDWGRLEVTGDARMKDWRTLFVALPKGIEMNKRIIKTPAWELTLADGWEAVSGKRGDDFVVRKRE